MGTPGHSISPERQGQILELLIDGGKEGIVLQPVLIVLPEAVKTAVRQGTQGIKYHFQRLVFGGSYLGIADLGTVPSPVHPGEFPAGKDTLIHKGLQVDEQGIACPGTESIVRGETAVGMADGHDLPYMDIRRSQEVDEITGIPAQCSNAEIRRQ